MRILVTARLAKQILDSDQPLFTIEKRLDELVGASEAGPLIKVGGSKAITAAKCFVAWSHEDRVRNVAAFASLAGVNAIPASSGIRSLHRLNRGVGRSLNFTLNLTLITRMAHDDETREYVEKRRTREH